MDRIEFIRMWADDLINGGHKQGQTYLKREVEGEIQYCCLGRAIELASAQGICGSFEKNESNGIFYLTEYDDRSPIQYSLPAKLSKFLELDSLGDRRDNAVWKAQGYRGYTLSDLNDNGVPFEEIGRLLHEYADEEEEAVFQGIA